MKGLRYLFLTTIKNYFKELKSHPAKLIALLFFVAMLGLVIFSSTLDSGTGAEKVRDISELYAMILALYSLLFVLGTMKGFSSGATFYSMADVNLLFSTPISSNKILIYGLIKQMGTSLMVGFFLIFQYAWLNSLYSISIVELLIILLGYCLVVFCSQLTAMAIYSFYSGNERAKKVIKGIIIGICAIVVVYIGIPVIKSQQDVLGSVVKATNSNLLGFIPVCGWVKSAVIGALTSNYMNVLIGLGVTIIYIFSIIFAIVKSHSDFYEDVLKVTEVSFSAITAKKQGKIADAIPGNVKVGKTGIGKGLGAGVFFYKHMLENRRARLFILDFNSILFILMSIGFAFFMRDQGIVPVFIFSIYMQVFSVAMGRWIRELTLPYVYMIPVAPFKKLVMLCRENMLKICVEALVLFIPVSLILNASIEEFLVCVIARIGFGILFMAGNILTERVLGSLGNKIIIMFLYFIIMIVLCIPGVVLGFFLGSVITILSPIVGGLLGTFIWNIAISAVIIFFCRNILSYAELNNR